MEIEIPSNTCVRCGRVFMHIAHHYRQRKDCREMLNGPPHRYHHPPVVHSNYVIPIQTQVQCVTCGIYFDRIQEHLHQVKVCRDGAVLPSKEHNFPFVEIDCHNNNNNGDSDEDMLDNCSTSNSPGDELFFDSNVEDPNHEHSVMVDTSNGDSGDDFEFDFSQKIMNQNLNKNVLQMFINGDYETFVTQFDEDSRIEVENPEIQNEEFVRINNNDDDDEQLPVEQYTQGTLISENMLFLPINTTFFQ